MCELCDRINGGERRQPEPTEEPEEIEECPEEERYTGEPLGPGSLGYIEVGRRSDTCESDECKRRIAAKGLCKECYDKYHDEKHEKVHCLWPGCKGLIHAKRRCKTHYKHYQNERAKAKK